ncbi:uncharacterized protein B0P05DRAFT_594055 [Gilbertella persicaria]|uniref:uncharacterized protein n=1 Tax=Gilbertella persicaria TaxID=101096 RepID=UPI002220A46C|nr:uncharacterized protein B0P05DRAFT_594055 [Gilbertella persicaria]KAI8091296.1 hypothetical protein B0P05DRAFT_594055 [Gilbertella persicaria]
MKSNTSKSPRAPSSPKYADKNDVSVFHVEETKFKKLDTIKKDFPFSGTDNGIYSLCVTTPFNLDRLSFHLKLYNKYAALKNEEDDDDNINTSMSTLPSPSILESSQVDSFCGYTEARRKLEKDQ